MVAFARPAAGSFDSRSDELERLHGAEPAHLADDGRSCACDLVEPAADETAASSSARARNPADATSSSTARAAAHATGLPPKVPPRPPGLDGVHDLGRAGDPGERKPAAERLAGHEQVRLDPVVLDGPDRAGAADARLHLVVDVEGAVLVAQLEQAGREVVGQRDEPALALHRLDDDAGDRRARRGATRLPRARRPRRRRGTGTGRARGRPRARTGRSRACRSSLCVIVIVSSVRPWNAFSKTTTPGCPSTRARS